MAYPTLTWLGVAFGLCIIGLTSAIDTALVGLPAARVRAAIDANIVGARLLSFWLQRPGLILGTLHFMRSSITLWMGVATFLLLEQMQVGPLGLAVGAVCLVTTVFATHILLRTLAKRIPVEVASKTMWLALGLTALLLPVVWPVSFVGRGMARLLKMPATPTNPFWTPDEIGQIATEAHAASLGERGEDLYLSIIEFSDTVIREIMVPRTEMVTVSHAASHDEVQQVVLTAGHSRIPVYDETIDNIVGILHVKDLFVDYIKSKQREQTLPPSLTQMLRATFYVPEVMKISELLREFQRRKTHLAIVVDEYGGTAGVVTLEDIIEEIVGEIHDEYDVEEKQFRVVGDKIIADARVSIWDLEEALNVKFPEDADYETLAGFLMSRTGSLPSAGMVIAWNQFNFIVKEANHKRIGTVEIETQK